MAYTICPASCWPDSLIIVLQSIFKHSFFSLLNRYLDHVEKLGSNKFQLVEHGTLNPRVVGSSPTFGEKVALN